MEFFSSFGGNPVSCSIGKSVLEVIKEEELVKNAIEVGNYFKSILLEMQNEFPIIYDIRGEGLFLGIEFRRPNETKSITPTIKEELKKRYILTSTDGPGERTLKVKPPMIFSEKNVDEFVLKLREILDKI
jgi:4-aminobutyrate aminotransferase-like enzyme